MVKTLFYIIFCCLFVPTSAFSQTVVRQLTNADGLSNNSINCIFEDSQQTLWVGTWDGLNAYNGRDFKVYRYNRNDPFSISNNVVRQVFEQYPGQLWISTDYGVNRWQEDMQGFSTYFLSTEHQIPKDERSFILGLTGRNKVVCYVKQRGLYYYDEINNDFKPVSGSPTGNMVTDFIIDEDDRIYFWYEHGRLEQYKIDYTADEGVVLIESSRQMIEQEHPVTGIFLSNGMLIVSYANHLKIIDDKNSYPTTIDINAAKTISQIISLQGRLLITYYEGGCVIYDIQHKRYEEVTSIPPRVSVFSAYTGSQDILWIGTDGQGLLKVYEHQSPFYTIETTHPVRAFCTDDKDRLLIGTKGEGIQIIDKQLRKVINSYTIHDGLISNSVYAIRKNNKEDIFIGTEGSGVNILYKGEDTPVSLQFVMPAPWFRAVYSIHFTNNDSLLWLGTSGYGLIKIALTKEGGIYHVTDVKQYTSTDDPKSLNNNVIYSIVSGFAEDELWLGTRGGGMSRFNIQSGCFDRLDEIDPVLSLTNNDVLSLTRDGLSLWIGTSYGLNHLSLTEQGYKIKEYTEQQGLVNTTIHGIIPTSDGTVWISTNQGITSISPVGNMVHYSSKDGLQNDEFSDGGYYKEDEDLFYFGGVSGFNSFNPAEIHLRSFDPDIRLNNLRIFNTTQNIAERIHNHTLRLAYDEAYVTFTFIAQDFINNENCEYDYRLLNFSDEWIKNGNNPNVVFTKLPPGKYTLQVKATNGDRVWGSKVYSVDIVVTHPWWLSTVAFIVYFLLLAAAGYVAYLIILNRIRMNKQLLLEHIEKQNQQKIHESKLNFFTNVAHEFFTPLTLIYGPAQHLLEKVDLDDYTKRYLQIIKNNSDRMQKLINELMEFRKVESGHTPLHPECIDIRLLLDYISDNYADIARENKIGFTMEKENISTVFTDRNSLEKIVFNLISNAFKYTPPGGTILVRIWQDDRLHLTIRNSGKGLTDKQMSEIFNRFKIFDTSRMQNSRSTGIGLGLAKSLAELLGGTIEVSSRLGEYVEFEMNIPPMQPEAKSESAPAGEEEGATVPLPAEISARKSISILLVEDERNIRELLRDILEPYYNIFEAGNGEEALTVTEVNMPDIIISDILMPHLDGIGLIDRLKSNPRTAHIPVINISAKTAVEDHISAYQHGADLYITKPFHPRHVLTTVENLISRHSVLKEYFNSSRSSVTVKDGLTIHQDDERLIQEIISFIERNIDDESLNPNSIAEELGLSKATLYRKLKDITGKTPSEYVRSIRLEYVARLLVTTRLSVTEIMFKSGFTNKSYFYREFAKQYGTSPKEYRIAKTERGDS